MYIIRPIAQSDLQNIMTLLESSGHGLTSLPKDPELLLKRIILSERSFAHKDPSGPNGETYLFVMEELFTGKIAGLSGIISKIGGFDPYYFYKMETEHYSSDIINVKTDVQTLHVHKVYSGPAEIGSLFLAPEFRNAQTGRFLSLSRFLFMANNRSHFEKHVIAEMRGRVDDSGHSPFWESVGKNFFQIDFPTADYLYMKNKRFIEDLLPNYPIIINLLPKEAREVVAEVHPQTEPAKHILEQEGFNFSNLVGIFEPGPVLVSELDEIRSIKDSQVVEIGEITDKKMTGEIQIITNTCDPFRACMGSVKVKAGKAIITDVTATALKLRLKDNIRFVKLKDKKRNTKMTTKKVSGKRKTTIEKEF